ncbi:MAG TPA: TetR family transcriptional regulator [Acidimicrobiales bacterium]|nr:TetR family transcriptional regulator [Acidimicrobiales bacterium]
MVPPPRVAAEPEPSEDAADAAAPDEDELRASDGRVPGRRGRATRQRLLDCTRAMLATTAYRDVKVIDIAREAGTSPATFYQYFADVEAAVLVLAEDVAREAAHLSAIVEDGDWDEASAPATAAALVDGFLRFWDDNRPVLRVMDLATDEGDDRFRKIRVGFLNDITRALAEVAQAAVVAKRLPKGTDPMATAGVLVSMLAHVAAHQYGFEFWGIRTKHLRATMVRQLAWGITGHLPD